MCVICGIRPHRAAKQSCQECADTRNKHNKKFRAGRKDAAVCVRCQVPVEPGVVNCDDCKAKNREYEKEYWDREFGAWRARKEQKRVYHLTNRDKRNMAAAERLIEKKKLVIEAYGKICACCEEADIAFLSIDHIFGDGAEHRRTLDCAAGTNFYHYLIMNNFPDKDRLQVLCHNCNVAKGTGHLCPHQLYKAFVDDRQLSLFAEVAA
jgi:hypothetical protein